MNIGSFAFLPKTSVGIDIGTSAIKIVELSRWGERKSLKNYGELKASMLYVQSFRKFEKNSLLLSSNDIARAIRAIFKEAKIIAKQAVFSLPDFSSFFTHFELPSMSKEELPGAIEFEARKHVPLPLSEVTFDWQILEGTPKEKKPFKILLVAVPNEVINQYKEIASLASLQIVAMEAEVFGLIRSSMGEDTGAAILLDIGAQSSTINAVYKKLLRVSHSIDIAGNTLTERIAQSLAGAPENSEQEKQAKGITDQSFMTILAPLIDLLIVEMQKVSGEFLQLEGREIEKVIIGGGSASLPGLKEYIEKNIGKSTQIVHPFQSIFYPPILEQTLKSAGPSYGVAVGMALRGFE